MTAMSRVWRAVVVAGAMLGTAHADSGPSDPPAKNAPVDQKSPDKPGDKPVDKAPAEKVPPGKDPAKPAKPDETKPPAPNKNKPVDKKSPPAADKKPTDKKADARPRGTDDRPVGRGFVLA
jgi:hypothetical protein